MISRFASSYVISSKRLMKMELTIKLNKTDISSVIRDLKDTNMIKLPQRR